jgi:anti-sigma B factor antagonist
VNFIVQNCGSYTIITVVTENLSAVMAPDLKSELAAIVENGEKNILLDLSKCSFCDTSGLSALSLGNRICERVKGQFIIYGLNSGIVEMMNLIGLDSILKIAHNKEAALALLV